MHFLISLIKVFFFVPYRGTTFLNTLCQTYARQTESGFRFLSGSYISQFITSIVSTILKFWFPSPIGELHFSIGATTLTSCTPAFPSPIGELHFSIEDRLLVEKCFRFRPLSGSYISQYFCWYFNNFYLWPVSVPYRGATFLNCKCKTLGIE